VFPDDVIRGGEPLSIAMIAHSGPGGSSRMAARLAGALSHRGHDVVQLAPSPWSTTLEPGLDEWRLARFERRVATVVRERAVDVLHYHYAWPFAALVPRLDRRLGAASPLFVGTLHGTDVTQPPARAPLGVLHATDALTTVSHAYAALARERLAVAPLVVANFIEDAPPRARAPALPGRAPRLVHVSSFRPVKDPQTIAALFASVRRASPAELWLVGDGPGLPAVVQELQRARLECDVRVFGYRADAQRLLAQCDVLVMSSREESFCLAALEAMAAGVPVVATAVGGLVELAQGGAALLYPAGDPTAGARRVLELLGDVALRRRLRAAGLERARAFSAEAAVASYERLYRGAALAEVGVAG
jgi:N-acetyl-alpha-D-glucosaminyl L-malate synthase BshA